MEYTRILKNQNKIISTTATQRSSSENIENFTIRFVFSGNELCTIGRRQLSIYNDSFIVINKGTSFTSFIKSTDPVTIFAISFDDGFLNNFKKNWLYHNDLETDVLMPDLSETIYPFKGEMRMIVSLLKGHLDKGTADDALINSYLHRCLHSYFNVYNEEIFQKAARLNFLHYHTRIDILRRLNMAKEYLYANYSRNINLENLADHACLSVNHLLRTFKLAYDQSPHQFLIQLRLQRAQLLLAKTEYPVYEIVNMVGFKCASSFIRLFRERYNTTPLKYRNVAA
jgi:AraC-like DNA-binding protein